MDRKEGGLYHTLSGTMRKFCKLTKNGLVARFLMRLIHGCLVSLQLDVCIIFPVEQIFHYSAQFAFAYG